MTRELLVTNVSSAYVEITNIINVANWHREHCHENCNIALYQLGMTCKRLLAHTWYKERAELERLIKETKWS